MLLDACQRGTRPRLDDKKDVYGACPNTYNHYKE